MPISTIHSSNVIKDLFKHNGLQKTRFGNFQLYVKLGLSFGNIEWGIVGDDKHKSYYFRGDAIDGCAHSEHHCDKMDIVLDKDILEKLSDKDIEHEPIKDKYSKLTSIKSEDVKHNITKQESISEDVLSLFLPEEVINFTGTGELRDIVSVFISFKSVSTYDELDGMVAKVLSEIYTLGGYLKGLDFGDKGGTMLTVFGSPVSFENNVERALNFILTVKSNYRRKIRAGITFGTVYAGIVGSSRRCSYDVLGDTVNMSARLMMEARWGKLWLSKEVADKAKASFQLDLVGDVTFKGIGVKLRTLTYYTKLELGDVS